MRRPGVVASIAVGAWLVTAACATPMTLEQVLERNTAAVGGAPAIERVQSVRFALTIVEPQFTVDGDYRADRRGRMRIDVQADGRRVFTEAYDGRRAWQMGDDGAVSDSSDKGTAALRDGIVFPGKLYGLHEWRSTGLALALSGRETIDGTDFHVVTLTTPAGEATRLYINPATWLIERTRVRKALHPDVDPTERWVETRHSDFRSTEGVVRPFRSVEVDVASGDILQTVTVKEIIANPTLDESEFQPPRP